MHRSHLNSSLKHDSLIVYLNKSVPSKKGYVAINISFLNKKRRLCFVFNATDIMYINFYVLTKFLKVIH